MPSSRYVGRTYVSKCICSVYTSTVCTYSILGYSVETDTVTELAYSRCVRTFVIPAVVVHKNRGLHETISPPPLAADGASC